MCFQESKRYLKCIVGRDSARAPRLHRPADPLAWLQREEGRKKEVIIFMRHIQKMRNRHIFAHDIAEWINARVVKIAVRKGVKALAVEKGRSRVPVLAKRSDRTISIFCRWCYHVNIVTGGCGSLIACPVTSAKEVMFSSASVSLFVC